MSDKIQSIKNVARDKTWVSFLHANHPYSLLHWSIGGTESVQKDVWLLQDEMTFETREFQTLDDALSWISEHLKEITDIL